MVNWPQVDGPDKEQIRDVVEGGPHEISPGIGRLETPIRQSPEHARS